MNRSDFSYDLPSELIAQQPLERRRGSRLLAMDGPTGTTQDLQFDDLPGLLRPGDLLVINDTRVIPARLFASKDTGGKVELMLERLEGPTRALMQMRASKPTRDGSVITADGDARATVVGREGDLYRLEFDRKLMPLLEAHGHVPLPPYIHRPDTQSDRDRYQTIYAERPGAVAAPTAGLHFDEELLQALAEQGVLRSVVTLHVGAGTFQPVRVEDITAHRMHPEWIEVSAQTCRAVDETRARGGRVVAVGTTVVRSLETAAGSGRLAPFAGDSDLFIFPGYDFRVVDAMITNFHLPESTLLMLVCAFAGTAEILAAYRHAIERRYRFFSYGDAMFVTRKSGVPG
jgi:S-adenosylmethionine:tRNA ribosyltransferase-isomerase